MLETSECVWVSGLPVAGGKFIPAPPVSPNSWSQGILEQSKAQLLLCSSFTCMCLFEYLKAPGQIVSLHQQESFKERDFHVSD